MFIKVPHRKIGITTRSEILLKLIHQEDWADTVSRLTAPQLQDLRNFLEQQVVHLSASSGGQKLTEEALRSKLEPVPNYYYKQDCREPLEACINETCLASNPGCFSKKMHTQLEVILSVLREYLPGIRSQELKPQ